MNKDAFQIERKRLADQIIDKLASMIADGVLKPGDKLPPEPELMKQFGVGRSSIREAVGALALIGLITVRPGHGTHVAVPSEHAHTKPIGFMMGIGRDKVRELVEARIELEQVIVKLAAERATEEDIADIREQHLDLKASLKNRRRTIQADLSFHTALAKASHNSVLTRFLAEMRQPMKHWMEQKAKYDWGYDKVYEQHDAIVMAVEARDGEGAQAAMRDHLESTGEKLVTAILGLKAN